MSNPNKDYLLDKLSTYLKELNDLASEEEFNVEATLEMAENITAMVKNLGEIQCSTCQGFGTRAYFNTSMYMGGIGGQTITTGTCNKCWGTGRKDRTGVNLKQLITKARSNTGELRIK